MEAGDTESSEGSRGTLQGAIVNHAYLRFLNSHRPHRSTHGLTHNDDSVC